MTEKQYTFKDIEQVETFVVARIITDRMQKDDNIKNLDSATSAGDMAERMYQHFLALYEEMHKGRSE
jgi:hypothetical protein